jgi:hypothetical protein
MRMDSNRSSRQIRRRQAWKSDGKASVDTLPGFSHRISNFSLKALNVFSTAHRPCGVSTSFSRKI